MSLESYRSLSRTGLVLRFVAIGAVAGIASCLLVVALSLVYDIAQPDPMTYLLASIRGAIFGTIMALFLWWRWHHS